jgi:hypothetical protein
MSATKNRFQITNTYKLDVLPEVDLAKRRPRRVSSNTMARRRTRQVTIFIQNLAITRKCESWGTYRGEGGRFVPLCWYLNGNESRIKSHEKMRMDLRS